MSAISGFCEKCNKFRKRHCDGNRNTCMSILFDTIEALQQEIEQYQERLKEIETTSKAIIRDKTEPDKVLIMAEDIEKMCGIVGEKITEALVYRNKKLQQENEQLQAHVARMRDALQYYADVKRRGTVNLQYVPTPEVAKKALAAIDKVIGGKEDV